MGGRYKDQEKRKATWNRYHSANRDRLSKERRDKYQETGWVKHLWKKYRLTEEQYWQIFAAQGGVCAISGLPPEPGKKLEVDHDHLTGLVRGLLRPEINKALGSFKEDENLLARAIEYLRDAKWGHK